MKEVSDSASPEHKLVFGTEDEARKMIGKELRVRTAHVRVSAALSQLFCGITEDGNASYWNEEFATRQWGALTTPPAMLFSWSLPLSWAPGLHERPVPLPVAVPLPGDTVVNARQEADLYEPIRVGDRLVIRESVADVSAEKSSHLGKGHFLTTRAVFERDDGTVVGEVRNIVFRYTAHKEIQQ
jgi:hypothetical protein